MDVYTYVTPLQLAFILFGVGYACYSLIYQRYLHPLRKFPGPFWATQTHLWKAYQLFTHRMPERLLALHEKYGPVVRYGPNDLSFQSPAAIAPIYKTGREMPKSDFYEGFTTFIPNLFGTRNEEVLTITQVRGDADQSSFMPCEDVKWLTASPPHRSYRWSTFITAILATWFTTSTTNRAKI